VRKQFHAAHPGRGALGTGLGAAVQTGVEPMIRDASSTMTDSSPSTVLVASGTLSLTYGENVEEDEHYLRYAER
jgi:hypothetical protein